MITLTEKQAFQTMVLFLEEFYQRTNSDEIGGLLSDLLMSEEGITADPAAWEDWQNCIQQIVKTEKLTNVTATTYAKKPGFSEKS